MTVALAAIIPESGARSDPLTRWNHPNHLAGCLADIADLLYHKGITERDPLPVAAQAVRSREQIKEVERYWKAAKATSRAARRVWTAAARRDFAASWGRIVGEPLSDRRKRQINTVTYFELVVQAAAILYDQDLDVFGSGRRVKYLGSADAWVTITDDDVSDIEIRWRIRDWLSLADESINIPPNPRLAAAAAWRIGAHAVAFQIILDAAAAAVAKRGL